MEAKLAGLLIIAVALAGFSVIAGLAFLNLSWWSALLLYSLVGAMSVLVIGWRKYRCALHHDALNAERAGRRGW